MRAIALVLPSSELVSEMFSTALPMLSNSGPDPDDVATGGEYAVQWLSNWILVYPGSNLTRGTIDYLVTIAFRAGWNQYMIYKRARRGMILHLAGAAPSISYQQEYKGCQSQCQSRDNRRNCAMR